MLRFEVEIRTFCNTSAPQEKAGYLVRSIVRSTYIPSSGISEKFKNWEMKDRNNYFWGRVSPCSPGWTQLRPLPVFAFWILGLKIQELGGGGEDMPLIPALVPLSAENSLPALGCCSFWGPLLGFCKCLDYLSWATWALCFQSAWWATFLSLDPNLHIEGC